MAQPPLEAGEPDTVGVEQLRMLAQDAPAPATLQDLAQGFLGVMPSAHAVSEGASRPSSMRSVVTTAPIRRSLHRHIELRSEPGRGTWRREIRRRGAALVKRAGVS
jgi:hypothetical protein